MNTIKIKEALETGLNYVLTAGWTRHQESDAQDIQDAIAELEAENNVECSDLIRRFSMKIIDLNPVDDDISEVDSIFYQFAESYHKQKCAECGKGHNCTNCGNEGYSCLECSHITPDNWKPSK